MKYIELPSLTALASSLSHQGSECNVSVRLEAYSCKNIKRDKRLFRDLEKVYWDDMGVLETIKFDPGEEDPKSSPTDGASSSPSHSYLAQAHSSLPTPFGPLGSPQSRKTLYLLIATLNVAFPDYTFDSVKPSSFVHLESGAQILNALSTTLLASKASVRSSPSRVNSGYASMAYGAYPAAQSLGFGVAQGSPGSPYEFVKESPYALPSVISGTHPEVYALLDDVIGPLDECEVYEYVPEPEEDPNAGEGEEDGNDDFEDELKGYSPDDDHVFTLDEDISIQSNNLPRTIPTPSTLVTPRDAALSTNPISPFHESYRPLSPARPRLTARIPPRSDSSFSYPPMYSTSSSGGNTLLWSSHWFFLNRKQKRILYVTVWARKRSLYSMPDTPVDEEYFVYGSEPTHQLYASLAGRNRRSRKFSDSDESDGSPLAMRFPVALPKGKERFLGWEGAAGAGARALGLGK
ncbi:Maf1 regulator-domain-containing protein [Lentinula detonsa]|uniref:Maf1 regulator-domain-containing protein n=1 Tax=Lentinula detonsa TaxID=2804962 RepID=A0A9W8P082_9AGAR|nr:Maf1 regulator-domain-containing protein [Lentinula detonsa]